MVGSIGGNDQLADMLSRGGAEVVLAEMPEHWVDALSVTGTPQQAAAAFERLFDAGADKVIVVPIVEESGRESLTAIASTLSNSTLTEGIPT